MDKKILKNYLYNISYQILVLIVPLITTPYISRVLGAGQIGTYSYVFSIANYFSVIAEVGLSTYGLNAIAAVRDDKYKVTEYFYEIFITKSVTTIILLLSYIIFSLNVNNQNISLYMIIGLNIINPLLDVGWFLQANEDFRQTAIRNYIVRLVSVLLIFIFVKSKDDLNIYALILQGSTIFGDLVLWLGIKKYFVKIKKFKPRIAYIIGKGFLYFLPQIALVLFSYMDKTMIGMICKSSVENGYYEQATKIEQIIITAITALSTVLMPRMSYLFHNNNQKEASKILSQSLVLTLVIAIPCTFGLLGIADYFIPWFLGDEFIPAIRIIKTLSFLIIFMSLVNYYGKQVFIPSGQQEIYNKVLFIGVGVNAILNYFLIRSDGANGASIASVISASIIALLLALYATQFIKIVDYWKPILSYSISSGVMCYVISIINIHSLSVPMNILIKILTGIIVYSVCLLILKEQYYINVLKKIIGRIKAKKASSSC